MALDVQNSQRTAHGLDALEWDKDLAQKAQAWADHLARDLDSMAHATLAERQGQGENLWWGFARPGPYPNPFSAAARTWMNEAPNYHQEKFGEGHAEKYDHYSE